MRHKISLLLLGLSSLFKFLGKMIITKEKPIIIDTLTLPGWFIIDECLTHMTVLKDKKLVGVNWDSWQLPDKWCEMMSALKKKA